MERLKLNIQKFAGPTNINLGPNGEMFGHIRWDSTVQGSTAQEKAQLNKSKVNGYLYVMRTDGYTTWGDFTGSININGTTRNFSVNLNVGNSWVLVGQLTGVEVPHNSDGSKSITISGSVTGPSGTTWAGKTVSGSATAVLDKIPRYATSVQSLKSKTETSITMNWSSDNTCDYIWYSKNNGSSWTAVGSVNAKSGSYTISGLTANTTYNIKTRVRRKDSQLTTDSSNSAIATYNYPNCTSAPNFTIGNSVTLQFYNPLNRTFAIRMWSHTSQSFVSDSININGTSYTFTPSANILYASIPNSKSSVYNIDSTYNNNKITKTGGSYSVNETTSKPTFSNFEYEDVNPTTLALTGDSSVVVQNYSNMQATIPVANKAVANNNATMKRYRVVIGEQTSDIDSNVIYKCSEANALLCTISGRKYYKTTNDTAFIGYYYNGSYTGPILVGTTEDSVKYTTIETTFTGTQITFQGNTYYVSSDEYYQSGNQTSTEGIAGKLSNSALTHEQAAEILLEKLVNDNEDIIIPAINNVSSNIINVYAEDSRGLTTLVSKTATLKAYTNIQKKEIKIERAGNVGTDVTLTYNGTFWNYSFGDVTNAITSVQYRYKTTSSSQWSSYISITPPTSSDNNYSFSGGIAGDLGNEGFTVDNSFNIEVVVSDRLSSTTFTVVLGTGIPLIAKHNNGVAIKQPYDDNDDSVLQVNGNENVKGNLICNSFYGRPWDFNTNNTTDTWVPVADSNGKWQHRAIPTAYNSTTPALDGVNFRNKNSATIEWKENGFGDKFRLIPDFGGADDSNKFKVQGTVGGSGADPTTWKDLAYITGKSGNVVIAGNISAANYNKVSLYNNTNGTNGTVTLSQTAGNFTYLVIYFKTNDNDYASTWIYSPNGKKGALQVTHPTGTSTTATYFKGKIVNISGTSITNSAYSEVGAPNGGGTTVSGSNNIYIVRVEGWK